jgi:hypothetical protein
MINFIFNGPLKWSKKVAVKIQNHNENFKKPMNKYFINIVSGHLEEMLNSLNKQATTKRHVVGELRLWQVASTAALLKQAATDPPPRNKQRLRA